MFLQIRKIFKNIFIRLRDIFIELYLKMLTEKKKFEIIYKYSYWRSNKSESVSGYGSSIAATKILLENLENFIKNEDIKKIFDAPCGDFFWIKKLNFENIDYLGGDIVVDLIKENKQNNTINNVNFIQFDILNNIPSNFDLIINRDCLVHFKNQDVVLALKNFIKSDSKFFASTTYPNLKENFISKLPDNWRPINLCAAPFNLPDPYLLLNDDNGETELDEDLNSHNKKYMGVWKIESLKHLKFD